MGRGFTLLEIILSLAILLIVAGAGFITSRTLIVGVDLNGASVIFVEGVRRAQMLSRGSDQDSQWGLRANVGNITLYKGASFASRDTAYDEATSIPTTITPSGTTEFTFTKLTGVPSAAGALTLTGLQDQSQTISINEKGTVSY